MPRCGSCCRWSLNEWGASTSLAASQGQAGEGSVGSFRLRVRIQPLEQSLKVFRGCLPQSPGSHSSLCVGPRPPFLICNPYLLSGHIQLLCNHYTPTGRSDFPELWCECWGRAFSRVDFCFLAACFCPECLSRSVRMHKTTPSYLLWPQTLSWHLGIVWCPHIVGTPLLASILPATEWPWETVCKKRAISKVTVKDSEPWFDLMALKLSDGMYSSWSKWGPQSYHIPQWLEKTDPTW